MSTLFVFWIFIKSVIDQAECNSFVDGDENKVNNKHEREKDTEFQCRLLKLHMHKIKDDEIGLNNSKRDESIKQNCFWYRGEWNSYFEDSYQEEYPKYFPDDLGS